MKPAFLTGLLVLFLFTSQGVVFASEPNFNPSEVYQVQTIPDGTKTTMIHEENSVETQSEILDTQQKPNLSDLTIKAVLEKEEAEKSLWESITKPLTQSFLNVLKTLNAAIVIPVKTGIHKSSIAFSESINLVQSSFSTFITSLQSSISHSSHTVVLHLSQSINNIIYSINNGVSQLTKTATPYSTNLITIATAGIGLSLGAFYLGRSLFTTSFSMGMEGVMSLGDMILRGVSLFTGTLVSLFTGKTILQGYELSLTKIKQWFGHDVGETRDDLRILGRNVVIGIGGLVLLGAVVYGAPALTTVSAATGPLATKVSPDVVLKTQYVLSKTANDCSLIGQCEDAIGLGITALSNTIFGISPSTPALANVGDDALMYADDVVRDGKALTKKLVSNVHEAAEEGVSIGKPFSKINIPSDELKLIKDTKKITINGFEYVLTDHAIERMDLRNITPSNIRETILNGEKFKYFHEGVFKTGYYDDETKIFVGYTDRITTVIKGANRNYIENLKRAK